ncbi:MAG TPA: CDP-alcohol phosphatidyltransferase family protein [Candidatus Cybelea sp.]|nr:CDP-alcohol phosphatidyltransferase family protein [Candidatus Cybelea sp.]
MLRREARAGALSRMLVWIDATEAEAPPSIFGLGLIERHLHAVRVLRPTPRRIIIDLAPGRLPPKLDDRRLSRLPIEWRSATASYASRLREVLQHAGGDPVLALDGTTVIDPRLPAAMIARPGTTAVFGREPQSRAAALLLAGRDATPAFDALNLADLAQRLVECGQAQVLQDAEFDGFIRRLRRTLPFYLVRVDSPERAARFERFLFWSNYKGSTDLLTRYVYPPLVWLLVRPFARWHVHPNWVTLLSIVLALGAIPCWTNGAFLAGFMMAYAMSVLDSVDGKLARLTFTDSEIGNVLDHGLDLVHPPLWYLAWAYGLGLVREGWGSDLGQATIAVVCLYVIDRLVLKIYPKVFGRGFHTHSRLDSIVRSFIARRNISLALFTLGYALDLARPAFFLIVAWQAATAAYHAARTIWILGVEKARQGNRAPAEIAGTTATLD